MRLSLLFICVLLFTAVISKKSSNKGRTKGGTSRDESRTSEDRSESRTSQDRSGSEQERAYPGLPKRRMVTEDNDVEHGPSYRMMRGEDNCLVQCRGSVSGRTDVDSPDPYLRYVSVDLTQCFDDETVFPANWETMSFEHWNATVNKLLFYKPRHTSVHSIPKRLSLPTAIHSSNMHCEQEKGCNFKERHFGFVVLIPRFDVEVRWTVEWEVTARNPYANRQHSHDDQEEEEDNCSAWNEWKDERETNMLMEPNAYSLDERNEEYSFWRKVGDHNQEERNRNDGRFNDRNNNRYNERRDDN